jgi:hypothetical protein
VTNPTADDQEDEHTANANHQADWLHQQAEAAGAGKDTRPITWTCDPPEFAAYVSHVDIIDRGDFICIEVDMRCKRVPATVRERVKEGTSYTGVGLLDVSFDHDGSTTDAPIVWPQRLGPWTGRRPTLTIAHGRTDLGVESESQGRYTTRVVLMRRNLPREEVKPGDVATLTAYEHGANHGREVMP